MTIIWSDPPKKRRSGKPAEPRPLPTAEFAPCDQPAVVWKPVVLRTCRGDCRLTPEECRRLAAHLDAAQRLAIAAELEETPPTEPK